MEEPSDKQPTPIDADSDFSGQPKCMQPIEQTFRFLRKHPLKTVLYGLVAVGVLIVGGFITELPKTLPPWSHAETNEGHKATPGYELSIAEAAESARGPVWDMSYSNADEVVARIGGMAHLGRRDFRNVSVVCFWRLAQGFETNWHLARRRSRGNYLIATVDGQTAIAGNWQALFGGIKCPRQYVGDIAVVLVAYSNEYLRQETIPWFLTARSRGPEKSYSSSSIPTRKNRCSPFRRGVT